jgi:hypothetical protein
LRTHGRVLRGQANPGLVGIVRGPAAKAGRYPCRFYMRNLGTPASPKNA